MYNWSTNTTRLEQNPKKFAVWKLEQQLNYGLEEGEQIDRDLAKKCFDQLKIDQDTKNLLNYLLYDKKPSYTSSK